jgi:hypothetical protein
MASLGRTFTPYLLRSVRSRGGGESPLLVWNEVTSRYGQLVTNPGRMPLAVLVTHLLRTMMFLCSAVAWCNKPKLFSSLFCREFTALFETFSLFFSQNGDFCKTFPRPPAEAVDPPPWWARRIPGRRTSSCLTWASLVEPPR